MPCGDYSRPLRTVPPDYAPKAPQLEDFTVLSAVRAALPVSNELGGRSSQSYIAVWTHGLENGGRRRGWTGESDADDGWLHLDRN